MPWAIILPMVFDVIIKCMEERKKSQDDIVEAMMNPGEEERRICRMATRIALRDAGHFQGKSFRKRRKILEEARERAWDRLENTTRFEAEVMVAGCAARVEANR